MTQEATLPSPTAEKMQQHPDLRKNLFWDDVRIGLKVICGGLIVLVLGLVISRYILPGFLVFLITAIGALATLFGIKITCSMPEETGVTPFAFGALGCLLLCLLVSVLYYVIPGFPLWLLQIGVTLGGIGHVLYAFVLSKGADYLKLAPLASMTKIYLVVAGVFSLIVIVFAWANLFATAALAAVVDILAVATAGFLCYITYSMSGAIEGLQQEPAEEEAA